MALMVCRKKSENNKNIKPNKTPTQNKQSPLHYKHIKETEREFQTSCKLRYIITIFIFIPVPWGGFNEGDI